MKKQITVPILLNHDMSTLPIGYVTIDEDMVGLLSKSYLGAGYIAQDGSTEVKELLAFGLQEEESFPRLKALVEALRNTECDPRKCCLRNCGNVNVEKLIENL